MSRKILFLRWQPIQAGKKAGNWGLKLLQNSESICMLSTWAVVQINPHLYTKFQTDHTVRSIWMDVVRKKNT